MDEGGGMSTDLEMVSIFECRIGFHSFARKNLLEFDANSFSCGFKTTVPQHTFCAINHVVLF